MGTSIWSTDKEREDLPSPALAGASAIVSSEPLDIGVAWTVVGIGVGCVAVGAGAGGAPAVEGPGWGAATGRGSREYRAMLTPVSGDSRSW